MSAEVLFDVTVFAGDFSEVAGALFALIDGHRLSSQDVGKTISSSDGRWTATVSRCGANVVVNRPSQIALRPRSPVETGVVDDRGEDRASRFLSLDLVVDGRDATAVALARERLASLEGAPADMLVDRLEAGLARQGRLQDWSRRHYTQVLPFLGDMGEVSPLIMLTGDPGTGKTVAAESAPWLVADRMKEPVRMVRTNDRVRGEGIQGRAGSVVGELFESLADAATASGVPCIALIDEADAVLSSRGVADLGSGAHENLAAVNAFLVNLDRLGRASARVMFVMVTNLPERIDPAAMRRAQVLRFPRLDHESARRLLERAVGAAVAAKYIDEAATELARHSPAVTGSDVFQQVIYPLTRQAVTRDHTLDSERLIELARLVVPTDRVANPARADGGQSYPAPLKRRRRTLRRRAR